MSVLCYYTMMKGFPASSPEQIFRSHLRPILPQVKLVGTEPIGKDYPCDKKELAETYGLELPTDGFEITVAGSDAIGHVQLTHSEQFDGQRISYIGNVRRDNFSITTAHRREHKGAVLAAYLALASYSEALGERMQSGITLTQHSLKLWNILVGAGVAEVSVPFRRQIHDGHEFYLGLAVMKPSDALISPRTARLHAEVGGDFERVGVGDQSAILHVKAAQGGDHSAIVSAKPTIGVSDSYRKPLG